MKYIINYTCDACGDVTVVAKSDGKQLSHPAMPVQYVAILARCEHCESTGVGVKVSPQQYDTRQVVWGHSRNM